MDDKENLIQDDSEDEEAKVDVESQAAPVPQLFIRVAHGLRMIFVLAASGFLVLFTFEDRLRTWVRPHEGLILLWTVVALYLILMVVKMWFFGRVHRVKWKSPYILRTNIMILLAYFALCTAEGFLVAIILCFFERNGVFLGAGIVINSYLSLWIFTLQTKFDFLGKGPYFLVAFLVLIIFGVAAVFLSSIIPMPELIFTCVIALLYSYIQIDYVQSLSKSSLIKGYMIMLKSTRPNLYQ